MTADSRAVGRRPANQALEPLIRVGADFEQEYSGASSLATECFANLLRAADLLVGLHNRQTMEEYRLSPSGRQVLAVIEGAGQPLEPKVIAERLVITTGSMTSLLDNLERRGLIRRLPHPEDRRKLLVDITPDAQTIVDNLLPSLHGRERDVINAALSPSEQREVLRLLAALQRAAIEAQSAAPVRATRKRRGRQPSFQSSEKGD